MRRGGVRRTAGCEGRNVSDGRRSRARALVFTAERGVAQPTSRNTKVTLASVLRRCNIDSKLIDPVTDGLPENDMTLFDPTFNSPWSTSHCWINPERRFVHPPTPDAEFLVGIDTHLQRIVRTSVGRTLLKGLDGTDGVVITPLRNMRSDWVGKVNVGGTSDPLPTATTATLGDRDATLKNEYLRFRSGAGARAGQRLQGRGSERGTGLGTLSVIFFGLVRCNAYGVGGDGVLVHELTHALENAHGAAVSAPGARLPGLGRLGFPTDGEFLAQVIMNMYLVELDRSPVVGYSPTPGFIHRPRRRASRSARTQEATVRKVRLTEQRLLRSIVRRAPPTLRAVFNAFTGLSVPYNPFRDVEDPNAAVYMPRKWWR